MSWTIVKISSTHVIRDITNFFSYDGPLLEEKALLRAAEGGLSSQEYVDLCRWLVTRLKPLCDLEESITSGPGTRTCHQFHFLFDRAHVFIRNLIYKKKKKKGITSRQQTPRSSH